MPDISDPNLPSPVLPGIHQVSKTAYNLRSALLKICTAVAAKAGGYRWREPGRAKARFLGWHYFLLFQTNPHRARLESFAPII